MPCFARPNAPKCPKILVNKQFYCPDILRERSFWCRFGMSVALLATKKTVGQTPEKSSLNLRIGRGVPVDTKIAG